MKAVRIARPGGPEVLELVNLPRPEPRAGEVLVRIHAAGVNRADLLQRMGRYPAPPGVPGDIPGLEFAGEIVGIGAGDDGVEAGIGDPVMGILGGGGYAEFAVVPTGHLLPVPEGLSWVEAAAIPEAFITAADAWFERGALAPGDAALVHAAGGGVGTAALQLARAGGASMVAGTASAGKLARIRECGLPLDVGIDYRSGSFVEPVREATSGRGVDVILDTVGGPYWDQNLASLAVLGRLVIVGVLGGSRTEVDLRQLMARRASVIGTVLRARSTEEKTEVTAAFRTRWLPRFAAGGELRPVVDRTFPLAEAAAAHRYVAGDRPFGKVVLEIA